MLWEWLHPHKLAVAVRLVETFWDAPEVTTTVLRLFAELMDNHHGRIRFGATSADGIILFKQASTVLHTYGTRILGAGDMSDDLYRDKLEGVTLCFKILTHAMKGGYVNFGVFDLYKVRACTLLRPLSAP